MPITRILALAIMLLFATAISTVTIEAALAAAPCCGWVFGKYVNLKTGKAVTPPKGTRAPTAKPLGTCCNK